MFSDSTEQNKALVHRYADEVVTGGNLAVIDELCAPDYVGHVPGFPPGNRETDKQLFVMFRAAFPDLNKTIEHMIAEGDTVAERSTYRGTHRGTFQGMPPTGKEFAITVMHWYRFAGGQMVEIWGLLDAMGMMQQLGALPTPAQQPVAAEV